MSEALNTVYIDMDGTMFDFDSAALADIPADELVPRQNFYVAKDYPKHHSPAIEARYNAPEFFGSLQPLPGVIEAWQFLLDQGYYPRVLSAPLSSNPYSVPGKIESLRTHFVPEFGQSVVDEAIFDKNKFRYPGLALIDDRPDVQLTSAERERAEWEHILFGWPHLETVPLATTAFRLLRWGDTEHLLAMLEKIKARRSSP